MSPIKKLLLHAFFVGMMFLTPAFSLNAQNVRINEFSAHAMLVESDSGTPPTDWRATGFDDSLWGTSILPLGMDRSSDYDLPINLVSEMYEIATSLYGRTDITVSPGHASSNEMLTLVVDYDDGFIFFINGVEVSRGNVGAKGEQTSYQAEAGGAHRASNDQGDGTDHRETYDLGKASLFLKSGINTLSFQVHNTSPTSSDLYMDLELKIGSTIISDPSSIWSYFVGTTEPSEIIDVPEITSDWIELYNAADVAVNLEGWSLTDNADITNKWIFPAVSIEPKGYLLVFAAGVDVVIPGENLQADFKLSSSGEYLGLFNETGTVVNEFAPEFPSQPENTSFGWSDSENAYQIFTDRTPGLPNSDASLMGEVADTAFSIDRGFYDDPFEVEITTETEGASIRYTTDGSAPSETNGTIYSGPIPITTTSLLRAIAYKDGYISSNVDTHTYIFVEDVIKQDNTPEGFPAMVKNKNQDPDLPADYEMDPEVTEDPLYKDKMRDALLSIPTISLVTDIDNLYDRDTGLYQNPLRHGAAWERPVSAELIYPSGKKGFQVNAGLRIQGGHTRDPSRSPKHSFRLAFRSEYGPGKLDYRIFPEPSSTKEFETIILRAHGNQSWTHHNGFRGDNRGRAQYVRDQFAKDLQGLMGSPNLHNSYAFLYLNGVFWGLYNPTERATAGYGEAYFGGDKDDYDALNSGELLDGDSRAWNVLMGLVNQNLSNMDLYHEISAILDLTAFTDYMLLNHWGGNEDWDHHNWYALRNRIGDEKWYFYAWDNEFFFETATADVTGKNTNNHPGEIFYSLLDNSEYRVLLADRIQHNFFNGGPLTTEGALPLWEERTAQVYQALVAESARWGDNRRDVNRRTGPYMLYTRDKQWATERERVVNTILPVRNETTFNQYKSRGWAGTIAAPDFSTREGALPDSDPLTISTVLAGSPEIYYTLDGSDPRLEGGDVSPSALVYASPINISERTTIKARIKNRASWSPVRMSDFHPAGDPADLQISEILYEPMPTVEVDGKELEFVEIRNSGPENISLDGMEISGGIDFVFPAGLSVAPGKHIVVVSNVAAFSVQNPGVKIAGEYTGSLSNSGDKITLKHAILGKIQQVVYSDWYPWPEKAATLGHSLIPVALDYRGLPAMATAWKDSPAPGGSPGAAEFLGADWIEHPALRWVYSETGTVVPGDWVYSLDMGHLYIGSEDTGGIWIYSPTPEGSPSVGETTGPGWIEHPTFGWVYSETGTAIAGDWLYRLEAGYLFIGSENAGALWTWIMN